MSHRFQVIADYWSKFRCQLCEVPLFKTVVRGKLLNSGLRNLTSKN